MSGQNELVTRFARDLIYYLKSHPQVDLESVDHATPEMDFDLATARKNKQIHNRSGDRIFITALTGVAYIRTRPDGPKYKLRVGKICLPFKKLYLTNTAQAGKSLSLIVGYGAFVDFAVSYFAVKILNVANTEINPSTEEKQDTAIAQLDIKLSTLRDAICDSETPKDLKDLYDQLYAMRGAASPKNLKEIWDLLTTISGLDFATDTTLTTIAGLDFATQATLKLIKLRTDELDVALSTRASQDTLALVKAKTDNLDLAITELRDAIVNAGTPRDLKDLYDQLYNMRGATTPKNLKQIWDVLTTLSGLDYATETTLTALTGVDFATQTTLALIKAKTDNLDLAITGLRNAICDTLNPKDLYDLYLKLNTIAGKDFATQTTLALIKTKTDLLADIPKEATNTPTTYNVIMANLNAQYSQGLPSGTYQLTFFIRGGGVAYRYAWVTGKVATPTPPYTEVPASGIVFLDKLKLTGKTLYFACGTASKIMQIEVLT